VELGVYVHFPWCRKRCPYCDFAIAVAPLEDIPHDAYEAALLAEFGARADLFSPGRVLRSVYFGGGTPALFRPPSIRRVREAVSAAFPAEGDVEVTVEANPHDCDVATLEALRDAGVNRLSIGAQAFDDTALVVLGRDHDAKEARRAIQTARAVGFASLSLDLIFALPGRAQDRFRRSLDQAIAEAPDHISVYQLTIESRTSFGEAARRGTLTPATDDTCAEEFQVAHETLTHAGYEHYEVSSYARPGKRSRHNSLYWRGAEYLGLGNGAHSFWKPTVDRGVRWSSHRSVVRYLAERPVGTEVPLSACPLVSELEEQDARALRSDAIWLGLRTSDGIPRDWLAGRDLGPLTTLGLLTEDGERIRPTAKGLLFADEMGARLLQ
jgi:oxygen-independent coproporphyrinogen-3 oxidase